MERLQKSYILRDLKKKMVFLSGPRQAGKTYLSKQIMKLYKNPTYLNYDQIKDREIIKNQSWHPKTDLLVLDEIHKMTEWKNYIKGVFDTSSKSFHILVTGSARLNTLSKGGDSLAGRYFHHILLPFSPVEIENAKSTKSSKNSLPKLLKFGGFPEPFLSSSQQEAQRWRNQYLDALLRVDLLDIYSIHNHNKMKNLVDILKTKVGSPVSVQSLSRDLQLAHATIGKYIEILENLYVVFRVTSFSRNITRSLLKSSKFYFYDIGLVEDKGARLENMIALCLLKNYLFLEEAKGLNSKLYFLRNKEGEEVDFVITEKEKPKLFIEVKYSDEKISKTLLKNFKKYKIPSKQIVYELEKELSHEGVFIEKCENFLRELSI